MKATLTFNLPSEEYEFQLSTNASRLFTVIAGLREWLRNNYKYEAGEISVESADKVNDKVTELIENEGINLSNCIFN